MQLWPHVISWRNPFEDRFCASKKGGIGGGGWVSALDAVHMAVEKPWSALAWAFLSFLR